MGNYFRFFRLSEGIRSSVVVSSGNVLGSGMSAVAMIILSRGLGPKDFGLFSALFSLLLITSRACDMGINLATHRYVAQTSDDVKVLMAFLSQAATLKFILSCSVMLLGWWWAPTIADSWIRTDRVDLVRAVIVLALVNMGYEFFLAVVQGLHKFTYAALLTVAQGTVKFLTTLGLFLVGNLSVAVAIYVYSLAPIVFLLGIWPTLKMVKKYYVFSGKRFNLVWTTLKWTSIAVISATITENIDVLLIQRFLSSYETGIFSAASRITLFVTLIGASVIGVMSIRVAKYRDRANLLKFLRKAHLVAGISLVGVLLLIPMSSFIISISVGDAYVQSQFPLALLLLSAALKLVKGAYAALFYLFDQPEYYAISGVLLATSLLSLDVFLIPRMGILGAAWARIISESVVLVFTIFYTRRSYLAYISNR